MNHTTHSRSAAQIIALLGLIAMAGNAHTASADSRWQVSFPVYLAAGAYYQSNAEASSTFQAVAGSAELLLSSQERPYSFGLFAVQVYSPDGRQSGAFIAGGLFEHQLHNWDTTANLFKYDARGANGVWRYFGRVRYRFADKHKLGIEVVGSLRDPVASNLMVGYYGTISRSFSVKLVVGSRFSAGQNRVARTELVWQFN
jgi:hypothetical protein